MRQGQQNRRGRNRSGRKPQNALSRNYESNGPNVKIRGTASHIADKYLALARDALSTGDVIVAESYFQHAEHYNRIIMAAQADKQNGADRSSPAAGNGRDHHDDSDMEGEEEEPAQAHAGGNAGQEAATSESDQNKRRRRKPGNGGSKSETTGDDGQKAGRSAQARRGRSSAETGRTRQKAAAANGAGASTDDGASEGFST